MREIVAKKISKFLKNYSGKRPGISVGILHKNKFIYKKSFGLSSLRSKRKITSQTNFRLASVTKQFTAYAILILIKNKKLDFEDDLKNIFPDSPNFWKNITIRFLLSHTSGLEDCKISKKRKRLLLDQEIFKILKNKKSLSYETNTKFVYCNDGYALLRMVIEKISGVSFSNFLIENIFFPLKMDNSVVNEENKTLIKNRAYGYEKEKKIYIERDQSITSFTQGAGAIYSSIEDLAKWNSELDNPKLISKKLLKLAWIPQKLKNQKLAFDFEDNANYGFGFFIGKDFGYKTIFHGGSTKGFRTSIYKIPEKHLTIILLSNCTDNYGSDLARKIFEIILES